MAIAGFDIYLYSDNVPDNSISQIVIWLSHTVPLVPAAIGFFMGGLFFHFFDTYSQRKLQQAFWKQDNEICLRNQARAHAKIAFPGQDCGSEHCNVAIAEKPTLEQLAQKQQALNQVVDRFKDWRFGNCIFTRDSIKKKFFIQKDGGSKWENIEISEAEFYLKLASAKLMVGDPANINMYLRVSEPYDAFTLVQAEKVLSELKAQAE